MEVMGQIALLGYRLDFFTATWILSLMFFAAGMYLKHVIVRPYYKSRLE